MPENNDFLNLGLLDRTLIIDMRYSYEDNFIGSKISGYNKNIAYLKSKAAIQLRNAQQELKTKNMSFIVYDAYRPQKASEQFFAWCNDPSDQKRKNKYYPKIDKKLFFELGYLARKSSHTKGIAVDISIYDYDKKDFLDMGGHFDLFDERSQTINTEITQAQLKNRFFLKQIMENNGFENLPSEWWHYSLKDSQNYNNFYDFDVE